MSNYVKCNQCGYYPSTDGYYCPNCGNRVNNNDVGVAVIPVLLVALILVGSLLFALISLFQSLKRFNYKRAIWFGIGGILWSILMFILYFYADDKHDADNANIYKFIIWSNIIGIISSSISVYVSISKSNKLNTKKDFKQTKAKNRNDEFFKENLINKSDPST